MELTRGLNDAIRDLIAADAATLAEAVGGCKVTLIAGPFTPGLTTAIGGLTVATFNGSTPKAAGTGAQQSFYNSATAQNVVQMLEPAGGWHWQCAVAPVAPETIYGWVLTDNAAAVTFGSELFGTPIVITNVGDAVDIPEVRFYLPVPMPQ